MGIFAPKRKACPNQDEDRFLSRSNIVFRARLIDSAMAVASVHSREPGRPNGPSGRVTHRITVSGGDRPGLIARLSEVFVEFKANIVRLNAERIVATDATQYAVIIAVSIPEENVRSCLATVANTAGGLGLNCEWEEL
jgi:predicted amino acid-binding ACT domain protein